LSVLPCLSFSGSVIVDYDLLGYDTVCWLSEFQRSLVPQFSGYKTVQFFNALVLLDFTTRTILAKEYRSLSSSLCNFLHSPVTSSLLGPNTPQHPILKQLQPTFLPQCQRPSFTPIQNNRQNYSSIYIINIDILLWRVLANISSHLTGSFYVYNIVQSITHGIACSIIYTGCPRRKGQYSGRS
jgi:hypothetical protein